jgi:alanine dehydrogenase
MHASRIVGVPAEVKQDEGRVAITPDGVAELRDHDIEVLIQSGAGSGAAYRDEEFAAAGAEIVAAPRELWERSGLICKVKEPQPEEYGYLRSDQVLFTFLHLAAYPAVADKLLDAGTTGIAYETVTDAQGGLPLLAPMSEIAGRMAVQIGAHLLERPNGGRGVLLGGAPGVRPGRVLVLGAGIVGWNAARMAAGLGAQVDLLDLNVGRLRELEMFQVGRITTLASNRGLIERAVARADLVVGAVLVPGGRAPIVVEEDLVRTMQPGSVIVDIAIDQGGCVETARETTHADPTYLVHDVIHYAVGNMPVAVPRTSTQALANATLPYISVLAREGLSATERMPGLVAGLNTHRGDVVNPSVAEALGRATGRFMR